MSNFAFALRWILLTAQAVKHVKQKLRGVGSTGVLWRRKGAKVLRL